MGTQTCIFVADAHVGTELSFGHSDPSHLIEIAVGRALLQLKNNLLDSASCIEILPSIPVMDIAPISSKSTVDYDAHLNPVSADPLQSVVFDTGGEIFSENVSFEDLLEHKHALFSKFLSMVACRRSMFEHSRAALAVLVRANKGSQSFVPIVSDTVRTDLIQIFTLLIMT